MNYLRFFVSGVRASREVCMLLVAGMVVGCASKPAAVAVKPEPAPVAAIPAPAPPPAAAAKAPAAAPELPRLVSQASTPRDYRRDAATHLYQQMQGRIYQGKLPPLLQAVGVLQVDIDRQGAVTDVRWMRAPQHAPTVMAEIERSVRAAAPYPAPVRMGGVTYTDTWLWHKTGRFQLDTLTEGQL